MRSSASLRELIAVSAQSVDEQTRSMFFGLEVDADADASPLDKLVAFLGRTP